MLGDVGLGMFFTKLPLPGSGGGPHGSSVPPTDQKIPYLLFWLMLQQGNAVRDLTPGFKANQATDRS